MVFESACYERILGESGWIRKIVRSLLAIVACLSYTFPLISLAAPRASLPNYLVGKWEVSEVHADMTSGRTVLYSWNSTALMWRVFDFKTYRIKNNTPEKGMCSRPTARTEDINIAQALDYIYGYETGSNKSMVRDYELNIPKNLISKFVHIKCLGSWMSWIGPSPRLSSNEKNGKLYSDGEGVFFLDKNKIALRWYSETLLVLRRISTNAKPSPSFSCDKARLSAEKAICESFELSGLDRSMNTAYIWLLKSTKKYEPSEVERLRSEQIQWLRMRNLCGFNKSCLSKSMQKRVSEIS